MKRIIILLIIGCFFTVIMFALTYQYWLTAIGKWLIISDPVVSADALVVSTGSFDRLYYAIQLWRQGLAPKIFLLSATWHIPGIEKHVGELALDEMLSQGIPRSAIVTEFRTNSTYEDALYAKEWALTSKTTSLLVLEDPFGMRRLRWTFRRRFEGSGVQISYIAVPPEQSNWQLERWWTSEHETLYVFEEYIKLIMYWIKY